VLFRSQLRIKEEICCEAFQRAGIQFSPELLSPALPSPDSYHYRYRIRLKLETGGQLGFFRSRSNRIVRIDQCPVATELKSLFYGRKGAPEIVNIVAGLGGRDVTVSDFEEMHAQAVSGKLKENYLMWGVRHA